MSSIFSWARWLCVCFLLFLFFWETAIQVVGPFCTRPIRLLNNVLLLTCGNFLFWKLTPYRVYGLQGFPPFPGLALPPCGCFHSLCKALQLAVVPLTWFCFCCLYFARAVNWCPARLGNFLLGTRKVLSSSNGAGDWTGWIVILPHTTHTNQPKRWEVFNQSYTI